MKQKGFSAIIILIAVAAILVIGVIVYGVYVIKNPPPPTTVPLTELDPVNPQAVGTPECPEVDYTGCDTTGNLMTWDGQITESTPPPNGSLLEK